MKKIRVLVLTAVMTVLAAGTAQAKLPFDRENGIIVIGNKAYSAYYLSTLTSLPDIKAINDRISQNKDMIYYVYADPNNPDKEIVQNISYQSSGLGEGSLYASILSKGFKNISYTSASSGEEQIYVYGNGEFTLQKVTVDYSMKINQYAGVNMGEVIIKYVKGIDENLKTGNGTLYYKLEHSSKIQKVGSSINFMLSFNPDSQEKVYILNSQNKVVAEGNIDLIFSDKMTSGPTTDFAARGYEVAGSSIGNINNTGFVAKQDKWIYYSNSADKGKIYKMTEDGSEQQVICEDDARCINVIGDTIYYCNFSDNSRIYKIKTDGTGRRKISNDSAAFLTSSDKYLYYANHSDGGRLYRLNVAGISSDDTTNDSDVAKTYKVSDDSVSYINCISNSTGTKVYYINESDNKKIYSINGDGLSRVKISDTFSATHINVIGDYIYFRNYLEGGKIYKINIDGTNDKAVLNDDRTSTINIYDGYIYYANSGDGNKLYKVRFDGSGKTGPLTKETVQNINVAGNRVYFSDNGKYFIGVPAVDPKTSKEILNTTAMTKPTTTEKITKVLLDPVYVGSENARKEFVFPSKVSAIMSTGQIKQLLVSWDFSKEVKPTNDNKYVYKGTLVGYGTPVTLTLILNSAKMLDPNNIAITNNYGTDKVDITGLSEGDIIKIYTTPNTDSLLRQSEPVPAGQSSLSIEVGELLKEGGSLWFTLTQKGDGKTVPGESERVEKKYSAESSTPTFSGDSKLINNIGGNDVAQLKGNGLKVGDIVKLYRASSDTAPKTFLKSANVIKAGEVTIDGIDFGAAGTDIIYATIISKDPKTGESMGESSMQTLGIAGPSDNYKRVSSDKADLEKSGTGFKDRTLNDSRYATGGKLTTTTLPLQMMGTSKQTLIRWTTSDPSVVKIIGSDAIISRPLDADKSVKLTATITEGDASLTSEMNFTIAQIAGNNKYTAELGSLSVNLQGGDTEDSVTQGFIIPTRGIYGDTVTWTTEDGTKAGTNWTPSGSPSKYITIDNANGVANVTRPVYGKSPATVKLSANIGGQTRDFFFVVKPESGEMDDLATAYNIIPSSVELPANESDLISKLKLNSISTNIKVTAASDNSDLIRVGSDIYKNLELVPQHPYYAQGDKTCKLTLSLTQNGVTYKDKKEVMVTVKKAQPNESEAANATANLLNYVNIMASYTDEQKVRDHILDDTSKKLSLPTNVSALNDENATYPLNTTIVWESSDPSTIEILGEEGTLKARPTDVDKVVILKANISSGTTKITKSFIFTVKKQ